MIDNEVNKKKKIPKSIFVVILFFIFLFPAMIDLMNGFISALTGNESSLGVIYRGCLLIVSIPFIFFITRSDLQLFLLFTCSLFIGLNFYWVVLDYYSLVREIQQLLRILYPYFLLGMIIYLFKKRAELLQTALSFLSYNGLFSSLAIVFSFLFGFGYETYEGIFGSTSFFKAQNDISLVILLSNVINLYLYISYKNKKKLVLFGINFLALLMIGTRAGILGTVLTLIFFLIAFATFSKKEIKRSLIKRGLIISSSLLAFVSVGYYIYFNIFLQYKYLLDKMVLLTSQIPRDSLTTIASDRILERGFLNNIFGEGYLSFSKHIAMQYSSKKDFSQYGKLVEQDLYDMVGAYGVVLGLIFILVPVSFLVKSTFNFIYKRTLLNFTISVMMLLFIFQSFLAGHAINSPTVSAVVIIMYFQILYHKEFYVTN